MITFVTELCADIMVVAKPRETKKCFLSCPEI